MERLRKLVDPRTHRQRGTLALGLWILASSTALLVLCSAPLLVAIVVLPADANPIRLGLLAFAGTGLSSIGLALGGLTALVGLLQGLLRSR